MRSIGLHSASFRSPSKRDNEHGHRHPGIPCAGAVSVLVVAVALQLARWWLASDALMLLGLVAGLIALMGWCAHRGYARTPRRPASSIGVSGGPTYYSAFFPHAMDVPAQVCGMGPSGVVIRHDNDLVLVTVMARRTIDEKH